MTKNRIDKNTTSEKLIKLASEGNEEALNMLLFRYNGLLTLICLNVLTKTRDVSVSLHDLMSTATIGLNRSLKYYDKNKSSVKTYINLVVKQELSKYIADLRRKIEYLEFSLNLDEPVFEEGDVFYHDLIEDKYSSIKDKCMQDEEFETFYETDDGYLSQKEKDAILLKAAGFTHKEIAKKMKTKETINDVALRKVRSIKNRQ